MIYRYILKEVLKFFFLFLITLLILLIISDLSLHTLHTIPGQQIDYWKLILYYGTLFITSSSILLPIAILISSTKVLYSLSSQKQLLALQTSGVSSKKVLAPILHLALFSTLFNFANYEWIEPKALKFADQVHVRYFKNQSGAQTATPLKVWHLEDGTKLIFGKQLEDRLFDVFFITNTHDIWHMKYLLNDPKAPMGYFIDHFQTNPEGILIKTESFESRLMDQIRWHEQMPRKGIIPIETQKISSLAHLLHHQEYKSPYRKGEVLTHFAYKILIPFLSILVVIGIAPYVMSNSRKSKIYLIYLLSLSSLIIFFTALDSAVILGENNVVPPLLAIIVPMGLACSIIFPKFIKMR